MVSNLSHREFGDIKISAKYRFPKRAASRMSFALAPFLSIDSGSPAAWFGNNSLSGGITLIADKELNQQTTVAFNLGYQFKDTKVLTPTQKLGDTIFYGVGIAHSLGARLFLTGEIKGSTPSQNIFESYLSPLEINVSLGYKITPKAQLIFGAGKGLSAGIGAPEWRVLTGVRFGL